MTVLLNKLTDNNSIKAYRPWLDPTEVQEIQVCLINIYTEVKITKDTKPERRQPELPDMWIGEREMQSE